MTIESDLNTSSAGQAFPVWLQAYGDAARAIVSMPSLFLITFAAVTAVYAIPVESLFLETSGARASRWDSHLARMTFAISEEAFILAPLLIAVHRYVILGETTRGFSLSPADRYLRFVSNAIVFGIATEVVGIFMQFKVLTALAATSLPTTVFLLLLPIAAASVPLLFLPMLVAFPAIAIDAPRVKALREGIRHYRTLFYTMLLAWLPALAILMAIAASYFLLMLNGTLPRPRAGALSAFTMSSAAMDVFSGAMTVFFGAVFAAAVSRLYRSFTGMDARV
jgi:hypothetical protein